jgi:hypothetical protein
MKEAELKRRRDLMALHLLDTHLLGIGMVTVRAAMLDSFIEDTVHAATRHLANTLHKAASQSHIPIPAQAFGSHRGPCA